MGLTTDKGAAAVGSSPLGDGGLGTQVQIEQGRPCSGCCVLSALRSLVEPAYLLCDAARVYRPIKGAFYNLRRALDKVRAATLKTRQPPRRPREVSCLAGVSGWPTSCDRVAPPSSRRLFVCSSRRLPDQPPPATLSGAD